MRESGMEMDLPHVARMRGDGQPVCERQIGHLPPFGDSAEPCHVSLHIMHRPRLHKGREGIEGIQLLAQRHRCAGGSGQGSMTFDIVIPEWFLKPIDVVILEFTGMVERGRKVPFTVSIYHKLDVRADSRSHRLDTAEVIIRVRRTNLDLNPTVSLSDKAAAIFHDLFGAEIQPSPVCVVGLDPPRAVSPEELPERQPRRLGLQIPERNVHRRQGQLGDPAAADPLRRREMVEFSPEPLHVVRILSEQERPVGMLDTIRNQSVCRQMGMGPCVSVAAQPAFGVKDDPRHTPVGDAVGAVCDEATRHRNV